MSLYDDDDTVTDKTAASGWASGIKMMQNQLAFKKATITVPKRDKKRTNDKLPPVIDLNSRKDEDENTPPYGTSIPPILQEPSKFVSRDLDTEWKFVNEYDPHWPNDYEKVVREMRDKRDREEDEKRRHDREDREKKRRDRDDMTPASGFSRPRDLEEEEERERPAKKSGRGSGAAIAPPPSLDEPPPTPPVSFPPPRGASSFSGVGGSVAAKIMAKYGFREGQGLGKSQQGIVKALEVEKTSKRGGRIVSDDGSPPPPPPPPSFSAMPPPNMLLLPGPTAGPDKQEANISVILKKPSKVLILLNMVGPGEVDDDLEPEVREECSGKYGAVTRVLIYEAPKAANDEAVRIFVEFTRVEASIKAVIDLNGRFFGGRQVKAGFYDVDNFKDYKLNETVQF